MADQTDSTSPTKLTPEQVADFERRAAEGERPVLHWYSEQAGDLWLHHCVSGLPVLGYSHVSGYPDGKSSLTYRIPGYRVEDRFDSLAAAQLAAEHLLRAATRPLHDLEYMREEARQKIAAEREYARQAKFSIGVPYDAPTRFLESAIAAKDARIAELEAALAEAKEDAERFAWVLKRVTQDTVGSRIHAVGSDWVLELYEADGLIYLGKTFDPPVLSMDSRSAIDKARKEAGK